MPKSRLENELVAALRRLLPNAHSEERLAELAQEFNAMFVGLLADDWPLSGTSDLRRMLLETAGSDMAERVAVAAVACIRKAANEAAERMLRRLHGAA